MMPEARNGFVLILALALGVLVAFAGGSLHKHPEMHASNTTIGGTSGELAGMDRVRSTLTMAIPATLCLETSLRTAAEVSFTTAILVPYSRTADARTSSETASL